MTNDEDAPKNAKSRSPNKIRKPSGTVDTIPRSRRPRSIAAEQPELKESIAENTVKDMDMFFPILHNAISNFFNTFTSRPRRTMTTPTTTTTEPTTTTETTTPLLPPKNKKVGFWPTLKDAVSNFFNTFVSQKKTTTAPTTTIAQPETEPQTELPQPETGALADPAADPAADPEPSA
jgi:hypothetical protein